MNEEYFERRNMPPESFDRDPAGCWILAVLFIGIIVATIYYAC